jgi:hypothetical protein
MTINDDEADLIWNRACMEMEPESAARPGDRHLSALLLVHGNVMNGGAAHAIIVHTIAELQSASEAARYFGLDDVIPLLERLTQLAIREEAYEYAPPEVEESLSKAYFDKAEDSILEAAFRRKLHAAPEDFLPI